MRLTPCLVMDAPCEDRPWAIAPDVRHVHAAGLHLLGVTDAQPARIAELIAQAHAQADVVPLRLGPAIDAQEAQEVLERRAAEFVRALSVVRGRTELGIRLPASDAASLPPDERFSHSSGDGASYLRARARHYARADGVSPELCRRVARWIEGLGERVERARIEGPVAGARGGAKGGAGGGAGGPCVALLVARDRATAVMRRCAERLGDLGGGARLSGPWAPFHFVGGLDSSI